MTLLLSLVRYQDMDCNIGHCRYYNRHPVEILQPWTFVIARDGILPFYTRLLQLSPVDDLMRHIGLKISVNPSVGKNLQYDKHGFPVPGSKLRLLLDPLLQLYNLAEVDIERPRSHQYLAEIRRSIYNNLPSAVKVVENLITIVDEGDEALSRDDVSAALSKFKIGLSTASSYTSYTCNLDTIVTNRPFAGLEFY